MSLRKIAFFEQTVDRDSSHPKNSLVRPHLPQHGPLHLFFRSKQNPRRSKSQPSAMPPRRRSQFTPSSSGRAFSSPFGPHRQGAQDLDARTTPSTYKQPTVVRWKQRLISRATRPWSVNTLTSANRKHNRRAKLHCIQQGQFVNRRHRYKSAAWIVFTPPDHLSTWVQEHTHLSVCISHRSTGRTFTACTNES